MSSIFENVLKAQSWKKSNAATAERLGLSLDKYLEIKQELKEMEKGEDELEALDITYSGKSFSENLDAGTAEYKIEATYYPHTAEEIENLIELDKTKYKLSRYSIWNGGKEDVWLVSAKVTALDLKSSVEDEFQDFLRTYEPKVNSIPNRHKSDKRRGMLIINKQDAHLTKFSLDGENNIFERFANIQEKTKSILDQATLHSNLSKITYVLGSDIFDSEWTGCTTKFTPQKEAVPYQEGFEAVCNHEVSIITMLLQYSDDVYIPFLAGNHDQYVGWHLVNWLKAYFKNVPNLTIDCGTTNSKYLRFGNSGFMLNHGDGMKPEKLAQIFPLEFKEEWSNCKYFNILSGDKHNEITRDIGGMRWYQVPAWSKAISAWDSKHGWTMSTAEVQALFVTEDKGITTRYSEPL